MEKARNPIFEPNKIVALVGYFFMTLIGSSIIISLIIIIYGSISTTISSEQLWNLFTESDLSKLNPKYYHDYAMVSSLGNMLSYILMTAIVVFYLRNFLKEDAIKIKERWKHYIWLIPVCAGAFYGLSYLIDFLIGLAVQDTSVNQSSIEISIRYGGGFAMFVAVVLMAPLVEELIYRKTIFKFLEKKPIVLSYIISILLFTIPHMLSTPVTDFGKWLLLCIPYAFSGGLLCGIYHVSGKNIDVSWFAHMLNNLIAFILVAGGM